MNKHEMALGAAYQLRTIAESNVNIANDEAAKLQLEYITEIVEDIRQATQTLESVVPLVESTGDAFSLDDLRAAIDRIEAICKALMGKS